MWCNFGGAIYLRTFGYSPSIVAKLLMHLFVLILKNLVSIYSDEHPRDYEPLRLALNLAVRLFILSKTFNYRADSTL